MGRTPTTTPSRLARRGPPLSAPHRKVIEELIRLACQAGRRSYEIGNALGPLCAAVAAKESIAEVRVRLRVKMRHGHGNAHPHLRSGSSLAGA
jgi:hypothetical protein